MKTIEDFSAWINPNTSFPAWPCTFHGQLTRLSHVAASRQLYLSPTENEGLRRMEFHGAALATMCLLNLRGLSHILCQSVVSEGLQATPLIENERPPLHAQRPMTRLLRLCDSPLLQIKILVKFAFVSYSRHCTNNDSKCSFVFMTINHAKTY